MNDGAESAPGARRDWHSGRWQVQLLGGFSARNGDVVCDSFPSRPVALLFARLLLEPGVAHARLDLARWLWPQERPRKGRRSADPDELRVDRLRKRLFELQRLLALPGLPPGGLFLARRGTVQVHGAAFDTDVQALLDLLARGDLAAANAAFARGLLPGYDDPWVEAQRGRLAALVRSAEAGRALPPGAASQPPGRRSVLVSYPSAWFGREQEQSQLARMLSAHRLVVVTGLGGSGKSRLCVHTAERLPGFDPFGFVPLTGCSDSDQVFDRVRAALGIGASEQPPLEQLAVRLSGQRALLVLDGFDALVGHGEAALELLLQRCQDAHVLLTTRRALERPGTSTLRLHPLPVPRAGDSASVALQNPSVALFADRARAARSDFRVRARNVAAVVQACQLLDGLPLALEIAAASVRQHGLREIGAALRERLSRPAEPGARGGRVVRHASLHAALGSSWHDLGLRERAALLGAAVLRGNWTPAHADALVQLRGIDQLLAVLVRDSLLFEAGDTPAGRRLGMLNSVREFVLERVPPRRLAALRERHQRYFHGLAVAAQLRRHEPIDADLPDFLAATQHALTTGDGAVAVGLAGWVGEHLATRGAAPEALALLQRVAQETPLGTPGTAALRGTVARLLFNAGRTAQARRIATETLALAGDDQATRAEALYVLTQLDWLAQRDHAAALAAAEVALELARSAAARATEARLLLLQGATTLMLGRGVDLAARCFDDAGRLFVEEGDLRGAVQALPGRVTCLMARGDPALALEIAVDAEQRAAALGHVVVQLQLLNRCGECQAQLGQMEASLASCRRLTQLARAHGMAYHLAFGLWNQCLPLARLSRLEDAARLLGFSRRLWHERFGGLDADDRRYVERVRRRVTARLGAARWRLLLEQGERLSEAEAVSLGGG